MFNILGGYYSDIKAFVSDSCLRCPKNTFVSEYDAPGRSSSDCRVCPLGSTIILLKFPVFKGARHILCNTRHVVSNLTQYKIPNPGKVSGHCPFIDLSRCTDEKPTCCYIVCSSLAKILKRWWLFFFLSSAETNAIRYILMLNDNFSYGKRK